MQPVISEEEGWRPLTGGRECACRLSETRQKPDSEESQAQLWKERCLGMSSIYPQAAELQVCCVGSHLQPWLWKDFWEYVRVSEDQENGMWVAMLSHQQWHSHKKRSNPLLTSGGFSFLSRSNIKGWGRRRNGPCKRGHIRAVFLFSYFRSFLAVLASLVHCSWESCGSSKGGFSSFCTSLPQHLKQIFFISQQLRTLCSKGIQVANIDAGAKALQMIENLQGTLQY